LCPENGFEVFEFAYVNTVALGSDGFPAVNQMSPAVNQMSPDVNQMSRDSLGSDPAANPNSQKGNPDF
jgi:hypothetical protein